MLVRPITLEEKETYNAIVTHPLQSWEWGEFKRLGGQKVERIGIFDDTGKLLNGIQVTFHPVALGRSVGYLPKGPMPDEEQLAALKHLARKNDAIFIKLEPNVMIEVGNQNSGFKVISNFINQRGGRPGKPLFTHYTFLLNLAQSEEGLFALLHPKTRYNIRLAIKKGVQIIDDSSDEGLETFIKILEETTSRQNFFAHDAKYYRDLWKTIGKTGIMKIFHAVYQGTVLVSWIIFNFNGCLYYPYGASSTLHREVMASNLMMWEVIKYGRTHGAKLFDMWGALGPDADPKDPWYGFHRFKQGYGGVLMENFTTFDLVYDQVWYQLFNIADKVRWSFLRAQRTLGLRSLKGQNGEQI
jgi:lipid II:glycine glycyltransferase (peptidoglycan interpeptide bridge formation enzyme)